MTQRALRSGFKDGQRKCDTPSHIAIGAVAPARLAVPGLTGTFLLSVAGLAGTAHAQTGFNQNDTTLVKPSVPDGFDHGRNVSVVEAPRPDYDPLGVRVNSFLVYPKISTGAGATSNPFLASSGEHVDGYVYVDPSIDVRSDWSRHALRFTGDADLQRYFSNSARNQSAWNADVSGKLEATSTVTVDAETQVSRQYESPFTGDVESSTAVVSNYLRTYFKGRAVYQSGRVRAQFVVDHAGLTFANLNRGAGLVISQAARDRQLTRLNGQMEYALTPSVSFYGQAGYDITSYDHRLADGAPNRDSKGVRLVAGINFDLAGFARGTVGVGYIHRDYNSALYKSVSGVSAEAKLEYFPSDLTTLTLALRRYLEDSSLFSNVPYFDNQVSLQVDHEVRRNFLVSASGGYSKAAYVEQAAGRDFYRLSGSAKYLVSHKISLQGSVKWSKQASNANSRGFNETRGQLGVTLQL